MQFSLTQLRQYCDWPIDLNYLCSQNILWTEQTTFVTDAKMQVVERSNWFPEKILTWGTYTVQEGYKVRDLMIGNIKNKFSSRINIPKTLNRVIYRTQLRKIPIKILSSFLSMHNREDRYSQSSIDNLDFSTPSRGNWMKQTHFCANWAELIVLSSNARDCMCPQPTKRFNKIKEYFKGSTLHIKFCFIYRV